MAFASIFGIIKGILLKDPNDQTKEFAIEVSPSATTGTRTTLLATQTADRTITLPDGDAVLLTADSTATLTNKTIDGTDNTLLNIPATAFNPVPGDANNFLVRNGSGAVVSNTKAVPTGAVVGISDTQTLTNKTIDADANTISNIENADIKAAAAIAVNKLAALTVSRAVVTDSSGFLAPSAVTSSELGFVSGVTSAIQTQLNAKTSISGSLTDNHVVRADGTANIQDSSVIIDDSANITGVASITLNSGGTVVGTTATQTLTNKTFGDAITGTQIATPSNPSSGFNKLYFKSDNSLYSLTSAGVETVLGGGGGSTPPTMTVFDEAGTPTGYGFYSNGMNATIGAVYSNNGNNFTVLRTSTLSDPAGVLYCSGTGTLSGTLMTKVSGTGDASFNYTRAITLATYTTPVGCVALKVTMSGAGGGGGGASSTASQSTSGGGGAGGAGGIKWFYTPAATYYYGMGVGGNAGAASGGNGGGGGHTSFDINWYVTLGGNGGIGASGSATATPGAAGGAKLNAIEADWGKQGVDGGRGVVLGGTNGAVSGFGGSSIFGSTIPGVADSAGIGASAGSGSIGNYGSGGSGGAVTNGSGNKAGGRGGDGMMIIEEYY